MRTLDNISPRRPVRMCLPEKARCWVDTAKCGAKPKRKPSHVVRMEELKSFIAVNHQLQKHIDRMCDIEKTIIFSGNLL